MITLRNLPFLANLRQRTPWEYVTLKGVRSTDARLDKAAPHQPRRLNRKPVYRTVRAFLRAKRREHNRRRWAAIGKIAPRPHGKRWLPKP
jgi:hypothetical protein